MRITRFAGATVAAAALVAGSFVVAAPAQAADTTVAGVINVATTSASVAALSPLSIPVSTNAVDPRSGGYMDATIVANGATYTRSYAVDIDTAGNGALDVMKSLSYAAFNYSDVPAGTYTITLSQPQDTVYNADFSSRTIYTAATSAPITVTVTPLATSVSNWAAKTKKVNYGKLITLKETFVNNAGPSNSINVQYKKGKKGAWKAVYAGVITTYSSTAVTYPIKWKKFDSVAEPKKGHKNKRGASNSLTRGVWYFRLVIPASPFATGATSDAIKITVK